MVVDVQPRSNTALVKLSLTAKDCRGNSLDVMLSDSRLVASYGEDNSRLLSAVSARDTMGNFAECVFTVRIRGQPFAVLVVVMVVIMVVVAVRDLSDSCYRIVLMLAVIMAVGKAEVMILVVCHNDSSNSSVTMTAATPVSPSNSRPFIATEAAATATPGTAARVVLVVQIPATKVETAVVYTSEYHE